MIVDLTGKRAVVCGSSQGIGRAAAFELASLGASVLLVARNEPALLEVKKSLAEVTGQEHEILVADFSDPETLREKINEFVRGHPPCHILVNNTGGPPAGPAFEAEPDAYLQAFSNHLICNQILVQALVPGMKAGNYGRIINIISTSVKQPIKGLGVSNTVRGAVANWAKTLADELGPFGITVNNVLPGATETGRLSSLIQNNAKKEDTTVDALTEQMKDAIPARRFAKPEELAYAVAFLASPSAAYINGINLPVDGGRTGCL